MTRTNRTLLTATLAIVTITAIGYGWPAARQTPAPITQESPQQEPKIEIIGASADQREMALWAIERFEQAGLPLPSIQIEFHATPEGCNGYLGHYSQSRGRLDVCNSDSERTEPVHTVLHELAHAWSFDHLPESTIDEFVAHRGLSAWHDADLAWWKQAREQAAEIVAWGLMSEDDPFINRWVIGEGCEQLTDTFALLTGRTPLHESEESCRSGQ